MFNALLCPIYYRYYPVRDRSELRDSPPPGKESPPVQCNLGMFQLMLQLRTYVAVRGGGASTLEHTLHCYTERPTGWELNPRPWGMESQALTTRPEDEINYTWSRPNSLKHMPRATFLG